MNGLSLFSGAGIGELALKHILPDYRTVGYVEWDKYCQAVIRARIKDGILDDAPIFGDIRHFNAAYASLYAGKVDWLSAGFPCQPFSVAGRRAGEADERNMWPATRDAICILRPRYVFLENVPALLTHGYIGQILRDLAKMGYDASWGIVSAADSGLPHLRERLWFLAVKRAVFPEEYRDKCEACEEVICPECGEHFGGCPHFGVSSWCDALTDSPNDRCEHTVDGASKEYPKGGIVAQVPTAGSATFDAERFINEVRAAEFIRTANGIPHRVDRVGICGNGWVPQVVRAILSVRQGS